MSSSAEHTAAGRYDGQRGDDLEARFGLPKVVVFDRVASTLDVAHELAAAGAPAGTLVLADAQTAGRGRLGRTWRSQPGAGIWLTTIERPVDARALAVLSLRVGLALAPALDSFAGEQVQMKWPNDLYVAGRKAAGILIEARWRDAVPEWIAIGVGINVRTPIGEPRAIGLRDAISRLEVLDAILPPLRAAADAGGALTADELTAFAARDFAAGRACVEPVEGRVHGIDDGGQLLVEVASKMVACRAGSLVLREET
ncbi:MAG TPA: biotin--[acetyl-CoA-carboxylase] ligase [Gemmatimonadaceae bacterium]|nr:biotin--[acetyl-CoA-carboxylase] ligase [Gemmatimonadaceae bacterium]